MANIKPAVRVKFKIKKEMRKRGLMKYNCTTTRTQKELPYVEVTQHLNPFPVVLNLDNSQQDPVRAPHTAHRL